MGDRFGHQGGAQLDAVFLAADKGVEITPVWNKSFREHSIIGTRPQSVRDEADRAVKDRGWIKAYFIDADHINLEIVDGFINCSDFFTLDVADFIGKPCDCDAVEAFASRHKDLMRLHAIQGIEGDMAIDELLLRQIAGKYLSAAKEAGNIYRHIERHKGKDNFIVEVSMDESNMPQTPEELLVILAAIAEEGIPAQTIAPKFSGRFNKGVDYVGDLEQFTSEFRDDLAIIRFAVPQFGLPANLKLSIHSGSDKFMIYPVVHRAMKDFDAGVHLKTAGTTWLEELIGLASAGGDGLQIAKDIYAAAVDRFDELSGPYATVIDINKSRLPDPKVVARWKGDEYTAALRHDQECSVFNPHFRQLLHVGYKIAAEMGQRFTQALDAFEDQIAPQVTHNLYRHIEQLFLCGCE
jgi:hypothetical protein